MRRRSKPTSEAPRIGTAHDGFHEWILSLPWVVERPCIPGAPGVRMFAIACEPLDVGQVWLVTGLPPGRRVAVVVPSSLAVEWEMHGVGRALAPMPHRHTLFGLRADADDIDVERALLETYGTVLS
jgi:hypothetical protein